MLNRPLIGILALQGDFHAHERALRKLGLKCVFVKTPSQLAEADMLIIPGGESTAISKLARENGLWDAIDRFERPIMGTCAGIILLASKIENPAFEGLGKLNIRVMRNAYGSQYSSFAATGIFNPSNKAIEMVFIRAPRILETGPDVEIVATLDKQPVGARHKNILGLTFHPELSKDIAVYHDFLTLAGLDFS